MRKVYFILALALVCQLSLAQGVEIPAKLKGTPELIIQHKGYALSFNSETNNPNWVAWVLTPNRTYGTIQRSNDFRGDPDVPASHRVEGYDYKDTGYDRGHMCPAADNKWDLAAMTECFYMSNMCPQMPTLNRSSWKKLEDACRRWSDQEDSIYIVCGPIYDNYKSKTIGNEVKIAVPTAFFKVVLSLRKGKEKAIGFYYTNSSNKQDIKDAAKSVDEIEKLTGIDFFYKLDDKIENRIESTYNLSKWN